MTEIWDSSGEVGGWNPYFVRPFNDWEVDLVGCFIEAIQRKKVILLVGDRAYWKESKNGLF